MKPLSALCLGALALVGSVLPASSETIMTMSTGRDYLQTGPVNLAFRGGDLYVGFRDGNAILSPCSFDPSPTIVTPNIFCPIGTTGFIANGDFDGDGLRDDLSFYSISQVIPAILVEPFQPDLCQLISAPPSDLPRPLGPFVDRGAIIFFNILTSTVYQFNVSMYEFSRNYPAGPGGRALMDDEIVLGSYIFVFPQLNQPTYPVPIAVSYNSIPEALDFGARIQVSPFRFTSGVYVGGFYLMDHRLTTEVTWTGNDVSNTSPLYDEIRISILDSAEEAVLFPPSGGDVVITDPDTGEEVVVVEGDVAANSLIVPSPLQQAYFLPPLLSGLENEDVFGQEAVFRLRFQRFRQSSGIAYDTSTRLFSFPILYVDSYRGFRISNFPTGLSEAMTAAGSDFDRDGQTNIEEYALAWGGDPDDAVTDPAKGYAPLLPSVNEADQVSFTMNKRPFGTAIYQFQISTDGGASYRTISTVDPVWEIIQDDETAYVIQTRDAADPADFTAKPKISEIGVR